MRLTSTRRLVPGLLLVLLATVVAPSRSDALTGLAWCESRTTVNGTKYVPIQGDFDNDGTTDIFWYSAGGDGPDSFWFFQERFSYTAKSVTINGDYRSILVGDFAGGPAQDLIFYGAGSRPDSLWISNGDMTFTKRSLSINGTKYRPVVLTDWWVDGKDDVLWYEPGSGPDTLWHFSDSGDGTRTRRSFSINGTYTVLKGLFNADLYDDLVFYGPGSAADTLWLVSPSGVVTRRSLSVNGNYLPQSFYRTGGLAGGFGQSGIYWLNLSGGADHIWRAANGTFHEVPTKRWSGTRTSTGSGIDLFWLGFNEVAIRARVSKDAYVLDNGTTNNIGRLNNELEVDFDPYVAISNNADFDGDRIVDILWYGRGSAIDAFWYGGECETGGASATATAASAAAPRPRASGPVPQAAGMVYGVGSEP
jgi:hypothetical protein